MAIEYPALAAWAVFMVLAWFYTQRHRQPQTKPVAAYLIFVVVFSTAAMLLFVGLSYLLAAIGLTPLVNQLAGAIVLLAVVFGFAFSVARMTLFYGPMRGEIPD